MQHPRSPIDWLVSYVFCIIMLFIIAEVVREVVR